MRNIPEDVYEFEDCGSEIDDSYTPAELVSDSSSCDESGHAFSDSFSFGARLSDRPPKRRRIQNQFEANEVSEEKDDIDSSVMLVRMKRKTIRIFSWHLTLHKENFLFHTLMSIMTLLRIGV